jgi:short subunit dehydrogenase-like uncharacterized protein
MPKSGEFDIVVYGASGFTGRLVAEYLAQRYGVGEKRCQSHFSARDRPQRREK